MPCPVLPCTLIFGEANEQVEVEDELLRLEGWQMSGCNMVDECHLWLMHEGWMIVVWDALSAWYCTRFCFCMDANAMNDWSFFVCLLNPNAIHFYTPPLYRNTLLSFHYCSSQPSQYLFVPNRAHTCLLNKSKVKQRLSPHYATANREFGFLAQANLE